MPVSRWLYCLTLPLKRCHEAPARLETGLVVAKLCNGLPDAAVVNKSSVKVLSRVVQMSLRDLK